MKTLYEQSRNLTKRKIGGITVLIKKGTKNDISLDSVFSLNGTSEFIYDLLTEPMDIDDILFKVSGAYHISNEDVDVLKKFIQQLADMNIIVSTSIAR